MPEPVVPTEPLSSPAANPAPAAVTSPPGNISATPPTPNPAPIPAASARPEYVPESFWDATAGKVKDDKAFSTFVSEHVAFKAAEDSKRLTLPQTADAYKVELPADFKPPEGVKFEFKADDPLLGQARTIAHQLGIPQEGFSKLLGLYAGAQVASQQQIAQARTAEVAKLGATGPARVAAVTTWAKAILGDTGGAQFAARMFTASDVENAEKLITRFSTQGAGSFRATGREGDPGGRLPAGKEGEATWEKMSYGERKAYAEKFPQTNGAAG